MNTKLKLNTLTRIWIIIVIFVHIMFFVLEAILWMLPQVHTILINLLNNPVELDIHTQALTLRNLFINQGFYNLFLVLTASIGLNQLKNQKFAVGYALLLIVCLSAVGAGIVLAFSTKAYLLAIFQALPALVAFIRIYPIYKESNTLKN